MSSIEIFKEEHPSINSYWRSLIFFGRNTALYKFALAKSLLVLASKRKDSVTLPELADVYSSNLCEHLKHTKKQTTGKNGPFIEGCKAFNASLISKDTLIDITVKYGLNMY